MAVITIFLTTTGTHNWTVPADWNNGNNSIECLGAGANGGTVSGAGGAYAKKINLPLIVGASIAYNIGSAASGNTYFNGTSLTSCSCGAERANANGVGGSANSSVGDIKFSGGNGGQGFGGGGAAGPHGAGAQGTSNSGGYGDANFGGAGGVNGSDGSNGTEWDSNHGSGGGGAPGKAGYQQILGNAYNVFASPGGNGGLYGSGGGCSASVRAPNGQTASAPGGEGSQGLIKITYTQLFPGHQFQAYLVGA